MRAQEFISERKKRSKKTRGIGGYFFPGYGFYGGDSGEGGGDGGGGGESRHVKEDADGQQVLDYIHGTHHEPLTKQLQQAVLSYPRWELRSVPVSSLHIPDQEYDDEEQEPEADPYNRVQAIDPDHAGEYSANFVDRRPIVVDADGWIIDGNHRAWAAAELLNRPTIRAWVPAKQGVAEGTTVTRIDSKPITDFLSSLKAYKHTDDWSQSGVDTGDDSYWKNKNLKTNTTKGLFAGDPKRTALYATGNAHETRYVEFTQDGQPIVYFDRKDLPAMRSRKTYLTVFDASDFRQLPTGEWFSENPSKPIKQVPIGDPFKYIASQGWIVRVTDDLDKVFKQVKNMHKAGKIAQYGAEGMNESKQGVAEGDVVPFKQPSKTLTWDQVPRDVLLLANDWFWASEDNSGLDATIDPKGFGSGTANDVKYNAAKLQQKGWTIDFNDEYDQPGEFNLRLTNKRGQTVLLPIEDAQDFTGWAKGTNQGLNEFAPPGSDDREPDEEEILRQLAAQWWNGTEQQMKKAQQTLQSIGWEIGQDESGDDDAGVFVIRIGDENGDSYIAFNHSDLSLDEGLGIPYPGTYEQDNEMTKTKGGQMRTLAIANEGNLSESLDYLEEK